MIIPSIDLQEGRAVQLRRGRKKVLERENPVGLARSFRRFGEVAVIDLDAAMEKGENRDLIRRICRETECRVGGGIRSLENARTILELGAESLIIGTAAFLPGGVNEPFLKALAEAAGRERVLVALDVSRGRIVVRGWRETTGLAPEEVIERLEPYAGGFLFTCVDREGMLQGTDIDAVDKIRRATPLPVTAAGGVASLEEISRLSGLGVDIQLGMSLYQGVFSVSDAFAASLSWDSGLLPTIVRDRAGRVLMLAYSNRESLARTFAEGRVWFFSRSRNRLWKKGETSGNFLDFLSIRTDCDGDALLVTADPHGPTCHTGRASCFLDRGFQMDDLFRVAVDRFRNPEPESYTARLNPELLQAKLLEEAGELAEASEPEEVIWEAADLIYFLTVKLARANIEPSAVLRELARRRRLPRRRDHE